MATYNKLRGRIYEKFENIYKFAEKLGVNRTYISSKLNGNTKFEIDTMDKWAKELDIPKEQYMDFFYPNS